MTGSLCAKADQAYLITGDDHVHDPAWGGSAVFAGSQDEMIGWLSTQPRLEQLSIVRADGRCLWAADYLESC